MINPLELIVYIHGVSSDIRGRSHQPEYETLQRGITARNAAWPTRFKGIEWGWNHDPGKAESHQLLTDAQRLLGGRTLPALMAPSDWSVNPARLALNQLRGLMVYGFSDMFYYVSQDGKAAIRDTVAKQITAYIQSEAGEKPPPLSITLLGHSAGSVIAFDFLFALFYGDDDHEYLTDNAEAKGSIDLLREMAQAGSLRVRRLYTFGSPITMLACRSDAVLKILSRDNELNPRDYGLTSQIKGADPLQGPRWLNLWDRDDPISWPVEPLMADTRSEPVVKDVYVDVSDSVAKSHEAYWASDKVHDTIAESW